MNEKIQDPSVRVSARRRLIRGVFAAPAALTLYSGSAFAAASQTCVAKQVNKPPSALPTASGITDIWLRVQLWTLGTGGNLSTWISGADVVALKAVSGTAYLSNNAWQCFTAGSGSGFAIDDRRTVPPTRTNSTLTHDGSYVALRVDAVGNIIGVVGISSGGSTVANTCWASFKLIPA